MFNTARVVFRILRLILCLGTEFFTALLDILNVPFSIASKSSYLSNLLMQKFEVPWVTVMILLYMDKDFPNNE